MSDQTPHNTTVKALLKESVPEIMRYISNMDEESYEDGEFDQKLLEIENSFKNSFNSFSKEKQIYQPILKLVELANAMISQLEALEKITALEKFKEKLNVLVEYAFNDCKMDLKKDWKASKTILQAVQYNLIKTHQIEDQTYVDAFITKLIEMLNILLWKKDNRATKLTRDAIEALISFFKRDKKHFAQCLIAGRFGKEDTGLKNTIVLGDEGGLFLLLNTISTSNLLMITEKNNISKEYIISKEKIVENSDPERKKIVIGEGSFGRVRLAMSLLKIGWIDVAEIFCVKKTKHIGFKTKSKIYNITDETSVIIEDFFSREFSEIIHSPAPFDMALINQEFVENRHRKGYLFMELFPENTAESVFKQPEYQTWDYQKPYILEILRLSEEMLNKNVFNCDLKPPNTIYDPISRKAALIDLGGSIFVKNEEEKINFDASVATLSFTEKYFPPELLNQEESVNLFYSLSYLCGKTLQEVTEETDLEDRALIDEIIESMIITDEPSSRLKVTDAIEKIKVIGSDEYLKVGIQSHYIEKLKKLIKGDPTSIQINSDIYETKEFLLKQFVTTLNPLKYPGLELFPLFDKMNEFLNKKDSNGVMVILGESGSGKSIALQLQFIDEVLNWEIGKPLPVYFNMADEVDIGNALIRLNTLLGSNIQLGADYDAVHYFIDSFDEGVGVRELKNAKIINTYMKKIGDGCKLKKIILTCRTDFVAEEGEGNEDLSYFDVENTETNVWFIAPITYKVKTEKKSIEASVIDWQSKINTATYSEKEMSSAEAMTKIKKLHLKKMMRTGFMFNLIMKNLADWDENDFKIGYIGKPEIYRRAIRKQIDIGIRKLSESQRKMLEKFLLDKELKTDKQYILAEAIEAFGEFIARELFWSKNSSRIESNIFKCLYQNGEENSLEDSNFDFQDSLIYQILKLLPIKFEKRGTDPDQPAEFLIGFRHDTFKNHFLLVGIKRDFGLWKSKVGFGTRRTTLPSMRKHSTINEKPGIFKKIYVSFNSFSKRILENRHLIQNFELVRFIADERDDKFKKSLRKVINESKCKYTISSGVAPQQIRNPLYEYIFSPSEIAGANAISILVAGKYCFSGEDLSNICIRGANLRGGLFHRTNFMGANLQNVNMKNTFLGESIFFNADLRGVDFGVYSQLRGHTDEVSSIAISLDGETIATGSRDNTIRLWSLKKWEFKLSLEEHESEVTCLAYHTKDNNILLSGGAEPAVKIWSLTEGKSILTITDHEGRVECVAFNPEGDVFATCDNTNIRIREFKTGLILCTLSGHTDTIRSVCFSPNGNQILTASDDYTLKLWDFKKRQMVMNVDSHTNCLYKAIFNKEGTKIASSSLEPTIKIWDSQTGNLMLELNGHKDGVSSIEFSPDGSKLASGSTDCILKLWDAATGLCLQSITGHSDTITGVVFAPNGKNIFTSSRDNTIRKWDSFCGEYLQSLYGHRNAILCVAFSPDGKSIASGCKDSTIKLWDCKSGEEIFRLAGHTGMVNQIAFSNDNILLASCSTDEIVKIWNVQTGEFLFDLIGHSGDVLCVQFNKQGTKIISGCNDFNYIIWDVKERNILHKIDAQAIITCVCFSYSGEEFGLGDNDSFISIWNSKNCELVEKLCGHSFGINAIDFCVDGKRLVSCSLDNSIKIWNYLTGHCLMTLEGHTNEVCSVVFRYDGKRIVSASADSTIRVWDSQTGICLEIFSGHSSEVRSVAYSPDGKKVASGGVDKSIKVWETYLTGHIGAVSCVTFSKSSEKKIMASGSYDELIKIWDYESGDCLHNLLGHNGMIVALEFSPDGNFLASSGEDLVIRVWDVNSAKCIIDITGLQSLVIDLTFSLDGKSLSGRTKDNQIFLWDACVGKLLNKMEGLKIGEGPCVFSPDNKFIATLIKNSEIKIWESSGHVVQILKTGLEKINCFVFRHDAMILAIGGNENIVKLWNVKDGQCIAELDGHKGAVWALSFSSDGNFLASGSFDRSLRVWDLSNNQCIQTLTRNISALHKSVRICDSTAGKCSNIASDHRFTLNSIAYSPDGMRIASEADGNKVKIWEKGTANLLEERSFDKAENVTRFLFDFKENIVVDENDANPQANNSKFSIDTILRSRIIGYEENFFCSGAFFHKCRVTRSKKEILEQLGATCAELMLVEDEDPNSQVIQKKKFSIKGMI